MVCLCFQEMGVGLAVFREGGEVTYYNLWLPARFPLLYVYVARKGDEEKSIASYTVGTVVEPDPH
jgi:hypothetical protein